MNSSLCSSELLQRAILTGSVITAATCTLAIIYILAIDPFPFNTAKPIAKDNTSLEGNNGQLTSVLHDRPQLQSIVQKGNAIWLWLDSAFRDKSQGIRIYWDNGPTSSNNRESAESTFPDNTKAVYIKVDGYYKTGPFKGAARSSEEILSQLVFELNNDKHWPENQEITRLAEAGKIRCQDYIRSCAKTEYAALEETADFYGTIWCPFCRSRKLQITPKLWGMPLEPTFDQWLLRYPSNSWYPWQYYGQRYSWINAQREGDSKLGSGDFEGAIVDYTQALKLGPRSYYWKGIAEMAKGDWDHSFADINQASALSLGDTPTTRSDQLLFWLMRVQKGDRADADRELSDYLDSRPFATEEDWISKVGNLLLDRWSEEDFLVAVSQDQAQHCEVWYYVGMKSLLAGDNIRSRQYFHKCILSNHPSLAEYVLARLELKRLEGF